MPMVEALCIQTDKSGGRREWWLHLLLGLFAVIFWKIFNQSVRAAPIPFPYVYQVVPDSNSAPSHTALEKTRLMREKITASPERWSPSMNHTLLRHLLQSLEACLMLNSGQPVDKDQAGTIATVERLLYSASNNYQQSQRDLEKQSEWLKATKWLLTGFVIHRVEQGIQDRFLTPEASALVDRAQQGNSLPGLSDILFGDSDAERLRAGTHSAMELDDTSDDIDSPEWAQALHRSHRQLVDVQLQVNREKKRLSEMQRELDKLTRKRPEQTSPVRVSPENSPHYHLKDRMDRLKEEEAASQSELAKLTLDLELTKSEQKRSHRSEKQLSAAIESLDKAVADADSKLKVIPEPDIQQVAEDSARYLTGVITPPTLDAFRQFSPKRQLDFLEQQRDTLNQRTRDLLKHTENLKTQVEKYSRDRQAHDDDITDLKQALEQLRQKAAPRRKKEAELKTEIQYSEADIRDYSHQIEQIRQQIPELEGLKTTLINKKKELVLQISEMKAHTLDLLEQMETLKAPQQDTLKAMAEVRRAPEQYQADLAHYRELESKASELGTAILSQYQPSLAGVDDELSGVEAQIQQWRREYANAEQVCLLESEHLEQLQAALKQSQQDILEISKKETSVKQWLTEAQNRRETSVTQERAVANERGARIKEYGEAIEHCSNIQRLRNRYAPVIEDRRQQARLIELKHKYLEERQRLQQSLADSVEESQAYDQKVNNLLNRRSGLERKIEELTTGQRRLQGMQNSFSEPPQPDSPRRLHSGTDVPTMDQDLIMDDLEQRIRGAEETIAILRNQLDRRLREHDSPDSDRPLSRPESPVLPRRRHSAPAVLNLQEQSEPYSLPDRVRRLQSYLGWLPWLAPYVPKAGILGSGLMVYFMGEKAWYARLKADSDVENALQLLIALSRDNEVCRNSEYPFEKKRAH